jgi:hypothetical protein
MRRLAVQSKDGPKFRCAGDQLGLKLVARKESIEVLVIDHAEKPARTEPRMYRSAKKPPERRLQPGLAAPQTCAFAVM